MCAVMSSDSVLHEKYFPIFSGSTARQVIVALSCGNIPKKTVISLFYMLKFVVCDLQGTNLNFIVNYIRRESVSFII